MKDRIQIDGVWYIKDNQTETQVEQQQPSAKVVIHPIRSDVITVEKNNHLFEAFKIRRDDGTYYDGVDITYTNKEAGIEELWDNNFWMTGVLDNKPIALSDLPKEMCVSDVLFFQAFLQYLASDDIGWLVRKTKTDLMQTES